MKILKNNSMNVADAVLALAQTMTPDEGRDGYVEAFDNGREQGYKIRIGLKCVAFAETRNSDTVVVFVWDESNGGFDNSMRHYFPNANDAARFVVEACVLATQE